MAPWVASDSRLTEKQEKGENSMRKPVEGDKKEGNAKRTKKKRKMLLFLKSNTKKDIIRVIRV